MNGDYPIWEPSMFGVVCGPMKAGKSDAIIRLYNRLGHQNRFTYGAFKPRTDTRGDQGTIGSRDGRVVPCTIFDKTYELLELAQDLHLVIVDEIQFCDEGIVDVINRLCANNKHVLAFGLDLDRDRKVFGPMGDLLAHADYVHKINAWCDSCGAVARYSQLLVEDASDGQVLVGGDETYGVACRDCHTTTNKTPLE